MENIPMTRIEKYKELRDRLARESEQLKWLKADILEALNDKDDYNGVKLYRIRELINKI